MRTSKAVAGLDVRRWDVVHPKNLSIFVRITIAGLRVWIKSKRRVIADRESGPRRDVRLIHLRAPKPVVGMNQLLHRVVYQACENDLLVRASLKRFVGALKAVISSLHEAQLEEIP